MRRVLGIGCFLACLALVSTAIIAQDKKADDKKAGGQPSKEEIAKMMEMMEKNSAPGEFHNYLRPMAGKFDCSSKFRMGPDAPWQNHKSSVDSEWILGNRFLASKTKGEPMMGINRPFEGFGLTGYDNAKKKYVFTWCDNYGTMIMNGEGTADGSGKTITMTSHFDDCMTGQPTWMKIIYKIESQDKYTMTMVGPDPTDPKKDLIGMEMEYTRKK